MGGCLRHMHGDRRAWLKAVFVPAPPALQIANRIKAKGLQKLRWYCQLCAKQCRDENGFKCHQVGSLFFYS